MSHRQRLLVLLVVGELSLEFVDLVLGALQRFGESLVVGENLVHVLLHALLLLLHLLHLFLQTR